MSSNPISEILAILLFSAAIVVVTAVFMSSADENVQLYINEEAEKFTNKCRTNGYIDPADYTTFAKNIQQTGCFKFEMQVLRKVMYPITDASDKFTGETQSSYIAVSTDEILEAMFMPDYNAADKKTWTNNKYYLSAGDDIQITIRRSNAGFTALNGILNLAGKDGDYIGSYGGTVYGNGVQ